MTRIVGQRVDRHLKTNSTTLATAVSILNHLALLHNFPPHQARNLMKVSATILFVAVISTINVSHASNPLSCNLGVLKDLGWEINATSGHPGVENPHTCQDSSSPVFTYNQSVESHEDILQRSAAALSSITSRCLVNREYKKTIERSIGRLVANEGFAFPKTGPDPRDPFIPPHSWVAAGNRGYDIPAKSIRHGLTALYTDPFVAECAAASQIAQLSLYSEHYGGFTDAMLHPRDVGIGIWPEYIKNPSIADRTALLLDTSKRKRGLKVLAKLGKGAFYGQSGYIKPYRNMDYIDSADNRGQNFVIVDISDDAVAAIKKRKKPIKELSKISRAIWKKYKKRLSQGEDKELLSEEIKVELASIDPFFSDVKIYVHPLSVNTFAFHIGRQFMWNPRTPFVFEMYEDYQSGYFFKRYVSYRLQQCKQQAYCRKIDRKHTVLTDGEGVPDLTNYSSMNQCEAELTPSLFTPDG